MKIKWLPPIIALMISCFLDISATPQGSKIRCCPDGWITFEDSCYLVPQYKVKHWLEARQFCLDLGGDLFVRNSQKEWDTILDFVPRQKFAWIGLSMHTWTSRGELDRFHHYVGDLCSYCVEYMRPQLFHGKRKKRQTKSTYWRHLFYVERLLNEEACQWLHDPEPHLVLNQPWQMHNVLFNGWACFKDCAAVHTSDNRLMSYVNWYNCQEQHHFICEINTTAPALPDKQWTCC